jgi:aryl-alcohol dehydrogenase-like predicted oxidoreductase
VPVAAVQVEYNPWRLDIEGEKGTNLLAACRELGVTVFAYSPLGRGMFTGQIKSAEDLAENDYRRTVPLFSEENLPKNLELVEKFKAMASKKGNVAMLLLLFNLLSITQLAPRHR